MRALILTLSLLLPGVVYAQIDTPVNLAVAVVSTGYDAAATSIDVTAGQGAQLAINNNCAWYDATLYPGGISSAGVIDPKYEIVRITAKSTDTLTITRAQEGTSASTKNTGGSTYVLSCGNTALSWSTLATANTAQYVTLATNSATANERVLTGTSNQITVTDGGAGSTVTLSTPQNIHTAATPTFGGLTLSNLTNGRIPYASTGGLFADDAELLWDATDNILKLSSAWTPANTAWGWQVQRSVTTPLPLGGAGGLGIKAIADIRGDFSQSGTVNQQRLGLRVDMRDGATVVNKTITGAANNGSGLIRITATGHTFATSDRINIYAVTGTTEANGVWTVTVIDANTFDLQGSTFTNAYVSGGTATNRPLFFGVSVSVLPTIDRLGTTGTGANGDDVNGYTLMNAGTGKATEAIYVANSPNITGSGWYGVFSSPAKADYGLLLTGEYAATSVNTGLAGAAAWLGASHTSNDTTTETQRGLYIKPTFNYGASNTNKTVNLFEVDSTNTSVTGLSTLNLLKASYGGSQRFNLISTGNLRVNGSDAATTFTDNAGTSRSAAFAVDNLVTTLSATLQANAFLTHLDWASDPGTRVVNGALVHLTTAADSIAQASTTYRAVNFIAQHNGSGAQGVMVGGNGQVTNASTGSIATATAVGAVMQNSNASGTITTAYGFRVADITNAGTITTTYGVHVGDISAGTQTNTPLSIVTSDANAPSAFNASLSLGATAPAVRATTEGTNQLKLFDGTAPVGTLTNGVSLYSTSGEAQVNDALGIVQMLSPHNKALTDNSATSVLSLTVGTLSSIGGTLTYTIEARDGTDVQMETGQVVWSGVNKAGTVTAAVTEVNSQQTLSAGTLTTAWTISAANPAVISVNANTSLAPSGGYPRITFRVDNNLGRQAFTLP